MKLEDVKIGMRVEAGEGEDHDTGTVDSIDGQMVTVRWDSFVVTTAPVASLSADGNEIAE